MTSGSGAELTAQQLELVDEICDEFESALRGGVPATIESFLSHAAAELQDRLLQELLGVELEYLAEQDETPSLETYRQRFSQFRDVIEHVFELSSRPTTVVPRHEALDATLDQHTSDHERSSDSGADCPAMPERIDHYEIRGVLGRGGIGVVYRAWDPQLKRTVALKMLLSAAHAAPRHLQRFRGEAEAVARLHHPNIVQVFALGQHDGAPYLVLELVEGGSLADRLQREPLEPRDAAELCHALARAVDYSHQNGVIHRDLKPGNVLIDDSVRRRDVAHQPGSDDPTPVGASNVSADGDTGPSSGTLRQDTMSNGWVPRLTDFGLARITDTRSGLTGTGDILGTPAYMSPEQARGGDHVDFRTDVYALGALLYRLLTGQPPFGGATALDTMRMVIDSEPVSPRTLRPGLSLDLTTICLKCLEKNRDQRYRTALELADDLHCFLSGTPIGARPVSPVERAIKWSRRHRAIASLLVLLVLVASAGTAGILWNYRDAVVASREARRLAGEARRESAEAKRQARNATTQRNAAREQLLRATSRELATRALLIRDSTPALSLLLARESMSIADGLDGARETLPKETMISLLTDIGGQPLKGPVGYYQECTQFGPTGDWFVTGTDTGRLLIYGIDEGRMYLRKDIPCEGLARVVAISQDGDWIAVGTTAGDVYLVDSRSMTATRLKCHQSGVDCLTFSRDGRWLISGGDDHRILIRDLRKPSAGDPAADLTFSGKVTGVTMAPDGRSLAITTRNGSQQMWMMSEAGAERVRDISNGQNEFWHSDFSPDGRWLGLSGLPQSARLHRIQSGDHEFQDRMLHGHSAFIWWQDFSADSRWYATCSVDRTVRVWDLNDESAGSASTVLTHDNETPKALEFHPRDSLLATAGMDGTVRIWNLQDEAVAAHPRVLRGHSAGVDTVRFSPDGRWILSRDVTGELRLWPTDTAAGSHVIYSIPTGAITPDAMDLVSEERVAVAVRGPRGDGIDIFDIGSHSRLESGSWAIPNDSYMNDLRVSPDRQWLAVARDYSSVNLVDLTSSPAQAGVCRLHYKRNPRHFAHSVAFSPDNDRVAASFADGWIRVWDLRSDDVRGSLREQRVDSVSIRTVAFSPCGRWLASGSNLGTLRLATLDDGWPQADAIALDGHETAIPDIEFSPNGHWMASAGSDGTVLLWRCPEQGTQDNRVWTHRVLSGHNGPVHSVAFNSSGIRLATGSSDGTIRVWDVTPDAEPSLEFTITGSKSGISRVAIAPDDDRIVALDRSGVLHVWQTASIVLKDEAQRIAGRELADPERRQFLDQLINISTGTAAPVP